MGEFKDIVLSLFFMHFLQFRKKYVYSLPLPFHLSQSPQFWKIICLFIPIREVQSVANEEYIFSVSFPLV